MNRNKKIALLGLCVCMLCGTAITAGMIKKDTEARIASVEHVSDDYEIMPHDGDVLVDSLRITEIEDKGEFTETDAVLSDDVSDIQESGKYFEELRATSDLDRKQVISMLTDVIENSGSEQEKQKAQEQKLRVIDYMDKEKMIENIIRTKGLPECFVLISDNAVNVTIDKQDPANSDIAKIYDIVIRETDRDAGQIVIQSRF